MTEQRPLKVFLCHASADKPAVRKLHRYLRQRGVQPWLDELDLLPGQDWQVEIPKAIFSSDVIVVCLSKNSVDKEGYVQKEIAFALDKAMEKPERTIFIIPAKLEVCDVPSRLSRFYWVDLYREDGRKRLIQSLNLRAASLPDVKHAKITGETTPRLTKPEFANTERGIPIEKSPHQIELPVEQKENLAQLLNTPFPVGEGKGVRNQTVRKFDFRKIGLIAFVLIILVLGALGINYATNNWPTITFPTPTSQTPTKIVTNTPRPATATATHIPPTSTLTPKSPTPAPTLGIGSTKISEKDGMTMVFVPAGEFTMGSEKYSASMPIHKVYLPSFWIDQTEVTNKMYSLCVDMGTCQPPAGQVATSGGIDYYGSSEFENYPVIFVDWNRAKTYCEWAGRHLPTEAEWEKAARGTDGRFYPWGNDEPDNNLVNFENPQFEYDPKKLYGGFTSEVGKYPKGASIYGAWDLAGNVWEWVSSLYWPYPYSDSDGREDLNANGKRILRGGSFDASAEYHWMGKNWVIVRLIGNIRSDYRFPINSSYSNGDVGFRCAFSE